MDIEKFKKDMAVFSFKQHQDVLTYLTHLKATGWTIEDAKKWVKGEQKKMSEHFDGLKVQQEKYFASLPKCPDCQSPLWVMPVNTGPGDQTGDGSKSMILCMNKECMYSECSTKTVQEQMKELSRK